MGSKRRGKSWRKEGHPNVVILSMHSDESYVLRALKAGARAYILKNAAEADLIRAVRAVSEGKSFFSPVISKMLLEDYVRQVREKEVEDSYDLLTSREREILQLLAEGKTNKEVASVLGLSPHTVETHRGNILEKLNLHSAAELILYAVRKGVIQQPAGTGSVARKVVPRPGCDSISRRPPNCFTRSSMPSKPRPRVFEASNPAPSSLTVSVIVSAVCCTETSTLFAPEWRDTLCRVS